MASEGRRRRRREHSSSSSALFPVEPLLDSLPSSQADFTRLIVVVSIAAAVAVTCTFIASTLNKPRRPFCDSDITEFYDPLSDSCEPCPINGICNEGKLKCRYGYKKHGKLCIEDRDINEGVKKLTKWIEVVVCEAYAQFLCSGTGKCWIAEDELWNNTLDEYRGLDKDFYMVLKERAMGDIHNLLETRTNEHGTDEFKCPEMLANHYKPLSCAVRHWIIKHVILVVSSCALFVGCILISFKAYRRHQFSLRVEQIYHEVCDILEEKPLISRRSGEGEPPWVAASWLRDHLLSPKERRHPSLWRKVEDLVQEDSRVDQYPKLVKGETKVVWEWQVEGSLGSLEKKRRGDGSASKLKEAMNSSSNIQKKMQAA
ncbi:uncharacterized protein LOC127240079 isoform X2 [Andrographis paniculata]|uniref:uncharacterized protein LOC127240079 isoform X2 n=1 Tax=Andrographis paniculata TaxID=175694 RepID=UPI0021E771C8|nr:uncharacterized protein LOC127240079 isoform X2 [Andrographis paniculata]